ncbi:MAG: T9SS type A sorting domain-containing protein [Ignavibacteriae bacterium]|nr:T9SS type A sorting domain-containing protein [Ignavibacteriota bacterium]
MLNIQSTIPFENVKIYSPQGILVKESATNIFDVSQFSAGIYFVEITVDGRRATKKFIKI